MSYPGLPWVWESPTHGNGNMIFSCGIHMGILTGEILFLFSTQFHGYGDPYWDIHIHTDIPTWIPIAMELG